MFAKKIPLVVLGLVALYTLAGFVVLPLWLEKQVPERLSQHLGWTGTVEDIRFNPFAMSLEVVNLDATDENGDRVASFDRLYANLGVFRLFTGVIALQDFEVDSPFTRLDLFDDYGINLARDWSKNNPASEEVPEDTGKSDPVKLYLDRVRISGGEVLFRDFSRPGEDMESFNISPLDLSLNDLATWPQEDGDSDYYLLAAIGDQTVEWEGDLSVAPLFSSGYLRISDVSYETLGHFLAPYLPYSLRSGSLTVSSRYELRSGDQFSLSTSDGEVSLSDLAMALSQDADQPFLEVADVTVPGVSFDLIQKQLATGTVDVSDMALALARSSDGQIDLIAPFQSADATDEEDASDSTSSTPFRWSIGGVELNRAAVDWRDEQPVVAADIRVSELNAKLGTVSHALAEPVDYEADLTLESGGRLSVQGQTTLDPFTLEAGISASELALAQFNPYLADTTNLNLETGLLSLDGNLDLDNQKQPLTGTFSGTAQITSMDLRLNDNDDSMLAWQTLRLEPLEYNISPARLEIGTVTLSDPNVSVIKEAGGAHNLNRIMKTAQTESPDEVEDKSADESTGSDKAPEFIFRINQVLLEKGAVAYVDRTVEPVFSTQIDQLNGSVTGLSNVSPQQGKVAITGRVGEVASLRFDGAIGALGTEETSDLKLKVDDVSLPALSPYFGRFLGYGVSSGKLDLDLDYQIAGSRIDADNRVLLEKMELGDVVQSDDAVNAPVKLGLALLRDRKGVIDIDLPIEGDLDDPEFRIGRVVIRTFVNLIAKAATSPFSMLGSLADMTGMTGEELGRVSFRPGQSEIVAADREKLEVLSKVLAERPSLLLKIRGAVSDSVDGGYLRRQRLIEQVGIDQAPTAQARISRLEEFYQQSTGIGQPLESFRAELVTGQGGEPDASTWEAALVKRLISEVSLPPETLSELSTQRGIWLRNTLESEYGVASDRLFLLEPQREAEIDDNGNVVVNFELEAR